MSKKKLELNAKAQSMIEYVAIIIVLIGVFIAMGTYYKRSLQGRYRQAGDALGAGAQYHTNVAPIHY